MAYRCDVDLVRPPGERRHERDPALVLDHRSLAVLLARDHVAVQATTGLAHMSRSGRELSLEHGWNEGVRVDLAVRMAERDTDLLASVLEYVDVAHVGQAAQLASPVAPNLDQVPDVVDALLAERRIVVGRVADDLATSLVAGVGRESVLENCDVVVGFRDLGFLHARPGRAQRAVIRGRMVGAILAPRRHRDPLFEQRIPANLAHAFSK